MNIPHFKFKFNGIALYVNYKIVYIFYVLFYVYVCFVYMYVYVFMPGAHRGQKRVLDLLELELQVIVTSERKPVLFTAEPSLAPHSIFFFF